MNLYASLQLIIQKINEILYTTNVIAYWRRNTHVLRFIFYLNFVMLETHSGILKIDENVDNNTGLDN